MDWNAVSFDWNRARAFLVTAEEGSLSAAARALGLAQPTLSRQVEALQQELGVVLFERFGRGLELTPAGANLVQHVRKMGEGAMALSIAAQGQSDEISGPVTISASDAYAGLWLPPILQELRQREPGLAIRVLAENSASDLMRREADIAIRNFRPKEPELVAKRITETGAAFYASHAYLDANGTIETPKDWEAANLVVPGDGTDFVKSLQAMGIPVSQRSIAFECSSYLAMWEMVRQGLGVGVLDVRLGDAEQTVARAAPSMADLVFPIWLVAHRDILSNRRLRLVFDFLADALKKPPYKRPDAPSGLG
ncbi:LysR family transcriptional regulator [Thalassococcus lentus]|uniref:LysR family transcriptional regulator n=1 Tax=Thalassococcus lentus TaxID=1210524 RepID=A0ABT4XV26_9RHOB|nr:LysR family transcriptional regulator [Thalassococcus lentus]MDA7425778.1 LysR family transcriptional regulator [Thalassococcus lentus]